MTEQEGTDVTRMSLWQLREVVLGAMKDASRDELKAFEMIWIRAQGRF